MWLLEPFVQVAKEAGATDLHLEGGLPLALRIRGELKSTGEPLGAQRLAELAEEIIGRDGWERFRAQGSFDLSLGLAGVRCRVNVMQTARGVGLAVRLLSAFQATLQSLNLHPSLHALAEARHGLVIVSGPTGSGKSTTLAALIQEINVAERRHVLTIESPIEYVLTPVQSFIRQREVGRHTPSVQQALMDALREDPDVLMVGELRDPETMRLTLNAAETGHLVLTTMHSSTAAEALQRLVSAFPAESQPSVCAQLADCLVAVVCQQLRYRAEAKQVVPECEVLLASTAVRSIVRQGAFQKLATALESGGPDGSLSLARYRDWLDAKAEWAKPDSAPLAELAPALGDFDGDRKRTHSPAPPPGETPARARSAPSPPTPDDPEHVLVIEEGEEPEEVLAQLARKKR